MTDTVRGVRLVPAHPGAGWIGLGDRAGPDTLKAMMFRHGGRDVWFPKRCLVIHGGRYYGQRWVVEAAQKRA